MMRLHVKMRSELNCAGNAFLEVLLVSTVIAGIVISVTLGVNALATSSLTGEAGVRGSYAAGSALLSSLDKDFAEADRAILVPGKVIVKANGGIPWTNSANFTVQTNFTPSTSYIEDNNNYTSAITNSSSPLTITNSANQVEIHLLKGGNILSVLTYQWIAGGTNSATFQRYTRSGLMNDFAIVYPSLNSPSYLVVSNLVAQYPFATTTMNRGYFTVEVPNPRDLATSTVSVGGLARSNAVSTGGTSMQERLILTRATQY